MKILRFFIIVILILAIGGYFLLYRPYLKIRSKANVLIKSAKELKNTLSKNDIDLLNKQYDTFTVEYGEFKKESKAIYWLSFVPYVADYKNYIEAGDYLIKAGKETINSIAPYADLIGFKKGQTSFVERSSEDRLQTAILTLDKVLDRIDVISEDINQAEIRIAKVDPKRYPEKIGKYEVRRLIENVKEQFFGLSSLFVDAKPLVKRLPEIFGKDKEKTYLILFQNDKELRATGGFLTSYAIFKIKEGKMKIERSNDIYTLDNSISSHPAAPREIALYHKGVSKLFIRDSNLYPDLPKTVETFNSLYKKSSNKVDYDGIITIDTKILVDMLKIFGDTEVRGIRFSAETDKRCDCPQVIYRLLDEVDRPVGYIKEDRKGILGDLMYALFYKAIGFSPSKYWGTLVQQMFKNLQEKHIMLYFVDSDLQKSIESLNFAGRIKNYSSDYLHINDVNFAGAKANLFVSKSVESKTTINNKEITREVIINYRNPFPHSDCNLERGGLCLNAPLRNWLRIYVPKGSKLISFDGSEKDTQTYEESDKTVFEGFLQVMPEGMAKVTLKYTLPATTGTEDYKLLIQKQAGTQDQKFKVEIDGKTAYDDVLNTDKEIYIK